MLDRRQFLRVRRWGAAPASPGTDRADSPAAPLAAVASGARRGPSAPLAPDLRPFVPTEADPWDAAKARHLLRRVSLAALPADVAALAQMAPAQAADRIVTAARNRPALAEPSWIGLRHPGYGDDATQAQRDAFDEANKEAMQQTLQDVQNRLVGDDRSDRFVRLGTALRERMTMVWANHYVTELRTYNTATWLFEYLQILHRGALGRVRRTVREVGTTPAMLQYLNGNQNRVGKPNENYARELLELFTMGTEGPDGAPTYTQADVAELARALTGWRTDKRRPDHAYFDPKRFDDGAKTIFGQTGAFGTDDVTPLLWAERSGQIAHFQAAVLYRTFVSDEPHAGVVAALAAEIEGADFELAPAVEALLQSAHFYDDAHVGAIVKAPVEVVLGSAHAFGLKVLDRDASRHIRYRMGQINQELFNPPDVAGWPGGTAWIDTSSFTERVSRGQEQVQRAWPAIADDVLSRPSAYTAAGVAAEMATELLPRVPPQEDLDEFTEVLLSGSPAYSWDPSSNTARNRVRDLGKRLVSLPSFQLR